MIRVIQSALPANRRRVEAVVTLRCVECNKPIFNTTFCVLVKERLLCSEQCADFAAMRRLRRVR